MSQTERNDENDEIVVVEEKENDDEYERVEVDDNDSDEEESKSDRVEVKASSRNYRTNGTEPFDPKIEDHEDDEYLMRSQLDFANAKNMTHVALTERVKAFQEDYSQTAKEVEYYEQEIAEAISNADGYKASALIKLRDEARDKIATMEGQWQKANADYEEYQRGENYDAKVQNLGQKFVDKTGFYNLSESQKKKWLKVDSKVVAMGYDPSHPSYWRKLENSLKGLGLITYSNSNSKGHNVQSKSTSRPKNGTREIKLSSERVKALEMAGYRKGTPEYQKMAKRYEEYDRSGGSQRDTFWNVGG